MTIKKFKKLIIIVTVAFCNYNFIAFSQATVTFETVTKALKYTGNKDVVKKLIITGKISGNDYSEGSEWREFRFLDKTFPNIEEVEILTDQNIPDYDETNKCALFYWREYNSKYVYEYNSSQWLKTFSAPNIKYVGSESFAYCANLTSVNFPQATSIGSETFNGCLNLTTINFPLVTNIGNWAFAFCSNLTSLDFPLVTNIGSWTFAFCYDLTTINFPLVTNIEHGAFESCFNLTSVDFPLVTNIGNDAFSWCENLTTVDFPLVANIGWSAFSFCEDLASVSFGTGFRTETKIRFDKDVFFDVKTKHVDLILGKNVLPKPATLKIWQSNNTKPRTNYFWKSIKIKANTTSNKK